MLRRYFYFWLFLLCLAFIPFPEVCAASSLAGHEQVYSAGDEPSKGIVLARQDDYRRRQYERQRRLEADRRRREQERKQRFEADRRRREQERKQRFEAEKRQRDQERRRSLEAQKKRRELERKRKFEAEKIRRDQERKRKFEAEKIRRDQERKRKFEAEKIRRDQERRRSLEAQKKRRELERKRKFEADRRRKELERKQRFEAEKRRRDQERKRKFEADRRRKELERKRQLDAARRRKELEQKRRLEVQRRRKELERQRHLQAEKRRKELERRRALEAQKKRRDLERKRRFEADLRRKQQARREQYEAERRRREQAQRQQYEAEGGQDLQEREMRSEEERWRKEEERQRRAEEEKWRGEEERERRLEAERLRREEERQRQIEARERREEERKWALEEEKWRKEDEQLRRLEAVERELETIKKPAAGFVGGAGAERPPLKVYLEPGDEIVAAPTGAGPQDTRVEKKGDVSSEKLPKFDAKARWRAAKNTRLLSVAVGDFKDASIPEVKNAQSDARYFASFAQSAGIPKENITCITNKLASRSEITDALMKLKMATTEDSETAILYFSGHGAPIIKDGKIVDSVLVPYDAKETSMELTGIKMSTLRDILSDTRGNWIVILDSCFSGKEGRSLMPRNVKALAVVPKDFNVVPKSRNNTWWITATSGNNYANSFPKKNLGLFTYYFLEAMNGEKGVDNNGDGLISLREAFAWTKSEVKAVSTKSLGRPQVPELIGQGDTILTMPK